MDNLKTNVRVYRLLRAAHWELFVSNLKTTNLHFDMSIRSEKALEKWVSNF